MATGGIVNIKADKYYITFNLKQGINGGIDNKGRDEDYTDQVVIHEGNELLFGQSVFGSYKNTILVGNLTKAGDQFTVALDAGNLIFQLCSIDKIGSNGVLLSIGLDTVNCVSNGAINRPRGMQTLQNGVPVTGLSGVENEILEFIMEIPLQPKSVTCRTRDGTGDVDMVMNFLSSPQILYSSANEVSKRRKVRSTL